jgi:hypothetical protein
MRFACAMIFFLWLAAASGQEQKLVIIRDLSACDTEYAAIQLENALDSLEPGPLENAYRAMAQMIMAKSTVWPFTRLGYFRTGRAMLEASIREDVTSVELRYLRFCVQTNVPFFLDYSSNIEEDKSFIITNWNKINDDDLRHRIKMYMMRSGYCDDVEIKMLSNG